MATLEMPDDLVLESKPKNTALWMLQVATALMFFMSATVKITSAPPMVAMFETIGLGQGFRYFTGSVELVAAALLLAPRYAGIGALILIPVMIGAVFTHIFLIGGSAAPAMILLIVNFIIAYGRGDRTLRLLGR